MRRPPVIIRGSRPASAGTTGGRMGIELVYEVRATNDVRNLVFPFYLIPDEEPA